MGDAGKKTLERTAIVKKKKLTQHKEGKQKKRAGMHDTRRNKGREWKEEKMKQKKGAKEK